jgi:hypothetical protein
VNKTRLNNNNTALGTEGLNNSINNEDQLIIKENEHEHDVTLIPDNSQNFQSLKAKDSKLPLNEYESDNEQNDFRSLGQKSKFATAPKLSSRNDIVI